MATEQLCVSYITCFNTLMNTADVVDIQDLPAIFQGDQEFLTAWIEKVPHNTLTPQCIA